MKIRVEVKNEILGNTLFWEGDETQIEEINNLPAKMTARKVVKDGKTRVFGMWVVSEMK